jgi:hypothetical protein
VELLHVAAYPSHQLLQQFMLQDLTTAQRGTAANAGNLFAHRAPWFDETCRLYRLFEVVTSPDSATGQIPNANATFYPRVTGKININAIWDKQILQAICDVNTSNQLQTSATIDTMFTSMMKLRSTPAGAAYLPGPTNLTAAQVAALNTALPATAGANAMTTSLAVDRPFLPLTTGVGPGSPADNQFVNARGIEDTILRSDGSGNSTISPTRATTLDNGLRLFQNPNFSNGTHPAVRYELLTKIFNRLTVRSNVFAVWVTVGFFEVENDQTTPPTLGKEIGRTEGRNVRHRMFAIVDRSVFTQKPYLTASPPSVPTRFSMNSVDPNNPVSPATVTPATNPSPVLYFSVID